MRWPVDVLVGKTGWSHKSAVTRTRLFIECTNRFILLVNDNAPLVHKTGLFGVIGGQVNSGKVGGLSSGGGHLERGKLSMDCDGRGANSIYEPFCRRLSTQRHGLSHSLTRTHG